MASNLDIKFYDFYITPAGEEFLLDNVFQGSPLRLSKIVVGSESYDPRSVDNQLALVNKVDECNILDSKKVGNTWQIAGIFDGSAAYNIGEMGLETDTGMLFAVHSEPGKLIGAKAESGRFYPRFSLNVEQLPADSITINLAGDNANLIITPELARISLATVRTTRLVIDGLSREILTHLNNIK